MAKSGCKYLLWGLESASQRVLDLMDKGTKPEDVSKLMKNAHAAGIANHVFMICGFPTETEDEFAQTIKFLDDHKDYIYAVHRGTFSLEPESPIFEHQERFGIKRSWLLRDTPTGGALGLRVSQRHVDGARQGGVHLGAAVPAGVQSLRPVPGELPGPRAAHLSKVAAQAGGAAVPEDALRQAAGYAVGNGESGNAVADVLACLPPTSRDR